MRDALAALPAINASLKTAGLAPIVPSIVEIPSSPVRPASRDVMGEEVEK
jgi:hypothetical protein